MTQSQVHTSTHLLQYSTHSSVLRASHATPTLSKVFTRIYCRYRNEKVRCATVFQWKALDYVELRPPGRMKRCTEKTSDEMFSAMLWCPHGPGAPSWHHKSTVPFTPLSTATDCTDDDPNESSPLPPNVHCGSGDDLWLPGLAGHLGATLSGDQRACRGLTVQAQATDHVLQSRAFRLPLLKEIKKINNNNNR